MGFDVQFIPLYGCSIGVLYYNPSLEPDVEYVSDDDMYHQITFMFLLFGIHITLWKF